jgi:rRNA maturation RNase YbeY
MMRQSKITFNYLVKPFFFPKRKELKQFLLSHAKSQSREIDYLQYVFCADQYLLELNKKFLNHNYLTDIISFPYSNKLVDSITADIYISVDRVKENSLILNISFNEELLRVIFHGYLHLLGMKDKSKEQRKLMRRSEENLIESFKKCFT